MKVISLDKLGVIGAFLTALATPCCFPMFAMFGSLLGLSVLQPFTGHLMYLFQGLVLIALTGTIVAYRNHRSGWPVIVALLSTAAVFYTFYVDFDENYLYAGLTGLSVTALLNFINRKKSNRMKQKILQLHSLINCPECGHQKNETMPVNACQYFYECENCHVVLRPQQGDCCVFCSYGSEKCPPVQANADCCS